MAYAIEGTPTVAPDRLEATSRFGLAPPLFDDGQDPERPSIGEGVVHKVHAPALRRADRDWRRTTMQRDVLAPADPHGQLQSIEAVQPSHPFLVDRPTLTSEQDPDAQKTERRPRVRQLADATRSATWSDCRLRRYHAARLNCPE